MQIYPGAPWVLCENTAFPDIFKKCVLKFTRGTVQPPYGVPPRPGVPPPTFNAYHTGTFSIGGTPSPLQRGVIPLSATPFFSSAYRGVPPPELFSEPFYGVPHPTHPPKKQG